MTELEITSKVEALKYVPKNKDNELRSMMALAANKDFERNSQGVFAYDSVEMNYIPIGKAPSFKTFIIKITGYIHSALRLILIFKEYNFCNDIMRFVFSS